MWYFTKAEVLIKMGKDPKTVRSLDKLIKDWIVIEKDWAYAIKEEMYLETIDWLKKRIADLENKTNKSDQSDLDYLNKEYVKLEKTMLKALQKCYKVFVTKKIIDPEKNPFHIFEKRATWWDTDID